ncbi:MAG: hypothetical protein ABI873_14315, partial [Marmoricola sp.]
MTKKQRRQLSIGWSIALVMALAALAASAGVSSALAADDPSSSPTTPAAAAAANDPSPTSGTSPAAASTSDTATPTPTSPAPSQTTETPSVTPTPTPTPCPLCPPDSYTPPDGTKFNHPFLRSSSSNIRNHVLRTVNSVPSGGLIRLAEFSLNDDRLVNALIADVHRGVSVQVVVNNHNLTGSLAPTLGKSPSFIRLRKVIGNTRYRPGMNRERVSFARICNRSCRGTGGNVHYKLFLFSSAGPGSFDPATGTELPTGRHWI